MSEQTDGLIVIQETVLNVALTATLILGRTDRQAQTED